MPSNRQGIDLASAAIPDTLAAPKADPEAGLTRGEANACLKEHGDNEVTERQTHPVLTFLRKFWEVSAWMLEMIMVLSASKPKFEDLTQNDFIAFREENIFGYDPPAEK